MRKTILIVLIILLVGLFWYFLQEQSADKGSKEKEEAIMSEENEVEELRFAPISHAAMVLEWAGKVIYTDPVGGAEALAGKPKADVVLVTDIHGDHLSLETLEVVSGGVSIIVPAAVAEKLPESLQGQVKILANGQVLVEQGFSIEAVPMYNVPESAEAFHTKGRGNGYVIERNGKRVYVSGDTGNTPELKNLKGIDLAFLSMNLPYTMSVEDAAEAVLAFKPKVVTPYHYRGPDGYSDLEKFKALVEEKDLGVEVKIVDFYPN